MYMQCQFFWPIFSRVWVWLLFWDHCGMTANQCFFALAPWRNALGAATCKPKKRKQHEALSSSPESLVETEQCLKSSGDWPSLGLSLGSRLKSQKGPLLVCGRVRTTVLHTEWLCTLAPQLGLPCTSLRDPTHTHSAEEEEVKHFGCLCHSIRLTFQKARLLFSSTSWYLTFPWPAHALGLLALCTGCFPILVVFQRHLHLENQV